MKILKKILAITLSVVISLSAMTITSSASTLAESAYAIESNMNYNFNVKGAYGWGRRTYNAVLSVNATESGTLTFFVESNAPSMYFYLYNENGKSLGKSELYTETGSAYEKEFLGYEIQAKRSEGFEKYVGKISYNVQPGTYYFQFKSYIYNGPSSVALSIRADVPQKKVETEIEYFTITLNKGDKIKLGAIVNMSGSTVEWKTSKKSVATVSSKGTVKAKSKGSAIITAMYGSNSNVKIKIIVE